MSKKDVLIYMRRIQLEVVIPEEQVFDFMKQFGKEFALSDGIEGVTRNRAVDGYYNHPNGWHVRVTISENEEAAFYTFLKEFCKPRGLSFRDPNGNQ